jgi:hypothetical protein
MVRQSVWVQDVEGIPTVVKYDTGETIFYNLSLLKPAQPVEAAPEEPEVVEEPAVEEEPEEEEEEEAEEEEEESPVLTDDEGKPYIPF